MKQIRYIIGMLLIILAITTIKYLILNDINLYILDLYHNYIYYLIYFFISSFIIYIITLLLSNFLEDRFNLRIKVPLVLASTILIGLLSPVTKDQCIPVASITNSSLSTNIGFYYNIEKFKGNFTITAIKDVPNRISIKNDDLGNMINILIYKSDVKDLLEIESQLIFDNEFVIEKIVEKNMLKITQIIETSSGKVYVNSVSQFLNNNIITLIRYSPDSKYGYLL